MSVSTDGSGVDDYVSARSSPSPWRSRGGHPSGFCAFQTSNHECVVVALRQARASRGGSGTHERHRGEQTSAADSTESLHS
jgi:hypothetical protein